MASSPRLRLLEQRPQHADRGSSNPPQVDAVAWKSNYAQLPAESQPDGHGLRESLTTLQSKSNPTDSLSPLESWLAVPETQTSRRKLKRIRVNPSVHLDSALLDAGHNFAVSDWSCYQDKADLTFVDSRRANQESSRQRAFNPTRLKHGDANMPISLKRILANYVRALHDGNLPQANFVRSSAQSTITGGYAFASADEAEWLKSQGIAPEDVLFYIELITSINLSDTLENNPSQLRIPISVLLHLLRRPRMEAETLRIVVEHVRQSLQSNTTLANEETEEVEDCESHVERSPEMSDFIHSTHVDNQSLFILFVRLLRHARRVWPESIPEIAKIIPLYLHRHNQQDQLNIRNNDAYANLTYMYNTALSLLSKPCSIRPFMSSIHQGWAQFDLLHAMSKHDPPLSVTRRGYGAVLRLQLMRRKTPQERDWVSLQAKSWPPWKEDRSGLDEDKDIAYGTTNAAAVLSRLMESGYSEQDADMVKQILAGWDIDGSPTVPTRVSRAVSSDVSVDENIWRARIIATRTVREAWACFLAYKDCNPEPSGEVHIAMIRKLLKREEQAKQMCSTPHNNLSNSTHRGALGERLEPFEEPISPLQTTYVRTPPPDPLSLFSEMVDATGGNISEKTLRQLLPLARSVSEGIYIGTRSSASIFFRNFTHSRNATSALPIRYKTLGSFLDLLCRNPAEHIGVEKEPSGSNPLCSLFPQYSFKYDRPIPHALRLLLLHRPVHRPAWNHALRALSDRRSANAIMRPPLESSASAFHRITIAQKLIEEMEKIDLPLDTEGLLHICSCYENDAIEMLTRAPSKSKWTKGEQSPRLDHRHAYLPTSRSLRRLFERVMFGTRQVRCKQMQQNGDVNLPRLLATPTLHELLGYVRALGMYGDHEGIWSLVLWMAEHKTALSVMQDETFSGQRRLRTLLTAVRTFLECPEKDRRFKGEKVPHQLQPADEQLAGVVRTKIESIPEWGGWPTLEELTQFIDRGTVKDE